MKRHPALLLLLAVCLFALFWRLGSYGLTEPDEGRTAGIGLEFHQSGTWLVPRLYELAQFNKPPLVYWACSLAYRIGGVNEFTARLPAALAALGVLLLTFALARRLHGENAAIAATLILLTAPLFFVMARIIDPNMILTFWITLTMWSALAWFQDGRKYQLWLFWIALGVAFLAKGPPALGVVALTLIGFKLSSRTRDARILPANMEPGHPAPANNSGAGCPGSMTLRWRPLLNVPAILVCAVIGLSWYVICALKFPELWKFFLGQELVGRLSGTIAGRSQPFWFFIPILLGGFLPWFPLLIATVAGALRSFRHDDRQRFLFLWVALPFIMFSVTRSKLPAYILPIFPPLAILMGAALLDPHVAPKTRKAWLPVAALLMAALTLFVGNYAARTMNWDRAFVAGDALWLVPAIAAATAACFAAGLRRIGGVALFIVVCYCACFGVIARHENELGAHSSPKKMCAAIAAAVRPGDRVVIYRNYPRGVSFYLSHPLSFSDKYEPQIASDWTRLQDRLYREDDLGTVYRWVDHEPRVFIITTARPRGGVAGKDRSPLDFLRLGCRKPLREIYRDDKYVAVCNFPPP